MESSPIFKQFKSLEGDIFCLILAGSYFSDNQNILNKWRDVDVIVVLNQITLNLQKEVSKIAKDLRDDPGIDVSVDIISKTEVINPQNILSLHTKVINAIYEANKKPSNIFFFDTPKEIYQLSNSDIKNYSQIAIRELFQEAHKDISRNLNQMLIDKDKQVLKKYIKRLFNIVKLAIINKSGEIPSTKIETINIAEKLFKYDFYKVKSFLGIINSWPDISKENQYNELLSSIFEEIYRFNKYLRQDVAV
ncbi:MAG TPA: hypothetical protein VHA74_01215 [Candidatus Dojkabacteria bacterium]|nr:hypothetical protein [Candidatus Dojkabacteria bacterium]